MTDQKQSITLFFKINQAARLQGIYRLIQNAYFTDGAFLLLSEKGYRSSHPLHSLLLLLNLLVWLYSQLRLLMCHSLSTSRFVYTQPLPLTSICFNLIQLEFIRIRTLCSLRPFQVDVHLLLLSRLTNGTRFLYQSPQPLKLSIT